MKRSPKISWLIPALVAVLALSFSTASPIGKSIFHQLFSQTELTNAKPMSFKSTFSRVYPHLSKSKSNVVIPSSNKPRVQKSESSSSVSHSAQILMDEKSLRNHMKPDFQFDVEKHWEAVRSRANEYRVSTGSRSHAPSVEAEHVSSLRANEQQASSLKMEHERTSSAASTGNEITGISEASTAEKTLLKTPKRVDSLSQKESKSKKSTKRAKWFSNSKIANWFSNFRRPDWNLEFSSKSYKAYQSDVKNEQLEEVKPPKAKTFKDPFSNEMRTEKYVPVRKVDGKQFYRLEGALDDFSGNTPQLYRFVKQKDGKLWTEIYNEGKQSKTLSFSEAHPTKDPSEITKVGVNNKKNAAVAVN